MAQDYSDGEHHFIHRTGWLRAAVLGANDGIVSTASLLIGVAAASTTSGPALLAGIAGLVAGAMSMAAGEFVSVSSQADTERADLATERSALMEFPDEELEELALIYEARGLNKDLARTVAVQLTAHDDIGAHARDELGMSDLVTARPIQAAVASASCFAGGAALPLAAAAISPMAYLPAIVAGVSLFSLAGLGILSASAGGAGKMRAVARVVFWGAAAMIVTGLVGKLFGAVV